MAIYLPLKTTDVKLMVSYQGVTKVLWGPKMCVQNVELYEVVRDNIKYLSLHQCQTDQHWPMSQICDL